MIPVYPQNNKRVDFYLIATDHTGQIIGNAYLPTIHNQTSNEIDCNGLIRTNPNIRGLATPLSLTMWHVLQTLSNAHNAPVTWIMYNENEEDLEKLKIRQQRAPEEDLEDPILAKTNEQQRWQNLFGENGKLGFKRGNKKRLLPKPTQPINIKHINRIILTKRESNIGFVSPKIDNIEMNNANQNPQLQMTTRINQILLVT